MIPVEAEVEAPSTIELERERLVRRFFSRYESALASCDAQELARMWSTPAFVMDDGGANVIDSVQEVERFFDGTRRERDKLGISDTRADVVRIEWATETSPWSTFASRIERTRATKWERSSRASCCCASRRVR
jgi:hypothetical protein